MFNQKHEREKFDYRFNGMYRGIVVDTSKGNGLVRVRVHSVYDGIDDEALPWAQYADPFFMTAPDSGSQITPDEGDRVWVFFEEGDHMHPVYFAGAPSAKDLPEEASPTNRVIKTKKGNMIEIDDTDDEERIKITNSTGSYVEMNNDKIRVEHHSGTFLEMDGELGEWSAPKLDLGEGGLEPMVLGDKMAAWAESLVQWLDTHQHWSALGTPTSAPIVPNQPTSKPAIFSGGDVYSTKNRTQ